MYVVVESISVVTVTYQQIHSHPQQTPPLSKVRQMISKLDD
jgi:hypothetical protein